jgi:GNAT superfamily N-acetyltransferase
MDGVVIEPCTEPAVIAKIHAATVSVAYRPYFPADSPPPTAGELVPLWETRLADPTATVLLATAAGRPVGSVLAHADATFPGGELAALHVLPSSWGQGVGSRLHDAALARLAESGHETAWLWVISANDRARRMYERRGWTLRGDVTKQYLGVPEVRYSRPLPLRRAK